MLTLRTSGVNRWAPSDGGVRLDVPDVEDGELEVKANGSTATAQVSEGWAVLAPSGLMELCPIGVSTLWFGELCAVVERVGCRYCTRADIEAHGELQQDDFDDTVKYPDEQVAAAIQVAEEAIEAGTGRSFCERSTIAILPAGPVVWLPVNDATAIEAEAEGSVPALLLSGSQASVVQPGRYRIAYGAPLPASLREACIRLAASKLRPRTRAEDARGSSVDGVYTSYTLATGEDGSWTGLPSVDAAIAENAARRVMVL